MQNSGRSGNIDLDMSRSERNKIIKLYAGKVCRLWDFYNELLREIIEHCRNGELNREESNDFIKMAYEKIKNLLGSLMIEQFYNTGQEDLFDRAMMFDENVELKDTSLINMNEFDNNSAQQDNDLKFLLYYSGLLFYLDTFAPKEVKTQTNVKIIVRDPVQVKKVNNRIVRARLILEMDETTIGKKYYQGILKRTLYSKTLFSP